MGFKPRAAGNASALGSGTGSTTAASSTPRFSMETFAFLAELHDNNDRDWFNANKDRYEAVIREPARAFIRAMAPHVAAVSPAFEANDSKMGGSLMRIHRDTRFGSDKTPYKTNVGIHFRHRATNDVHGPGLYVHLALDGCFLGVGSWHPIPPVLASIRKRIAENPKAWLKARDDKGFRRYFSLEGDSLKRIPRGFDEGHPQADDLRRKDHTAMCAFALDEAAERGFVGFCATRFGATKPYAEFLIQAALAADV